MVAIFQIKKLTVVSGILKLLEHGNSIMADRGFTIEDILPPGVSLNVPPRLNETGQLTENERTTTRRITSVSIHVERAIERIKIIRFYISSQYIYNQ